MRLPEIDRSGLVSPDPIGLVLVDADIYLVHFPVQCAVKVIDEYAGLGLNYSTKAVWLSYAAAVMISALLYRFVIAKAAEKAVFGFFKKKKTSPQKNKA